MNSPSYRQFLAYFVPLALQTIAQSLTYPLVTMVASRGEGGPLNLAGLAQSQTVSGVFWTLGVGLVTAGMLFGKTREGLARCVRINNGIILAVVGIYGILILPPVAHFLFGRMLGLPPLIEKPAYTTFIASLPLMVLFFLRNPYQIVLFNSNATGRAFGATMGRILLTLVLSPLLCALDAVGPIWAVFCLTLPVALELILSRALALPFMKKIEQDARRPPAYLEILVFALTLSVGVFFLSLSGFMLGAFIARTANPEHMLTVYYMVLGIVGPLAVGATRIQALLITYYGQAEQVNRKLRRFTLAVGVIMGMLPLVLLLPGIMEFYYVDLQKLDPADMPLVRNVAWALVFFPCAVALRAYSEGKAAWLKKPVTVLTGHAVYLAVVAVVAFFALNAGMPGHLLGALALLLANLAAAGMILFSLHWEQRGDVPVPAMSLDE